jgi:hypothetical protein
MNAELSEIIMEINDLREFCVISTHDLKPHRHRFLLIKWRRKQNNIRAARFAGCPAADPPAPQSRDGSATLSVPIDKVAAETEQHKSGPLCGLSRR